MSPKLKIKNQIKKLALEVRSEKIKFKDSQRNIQISSISITEWREGLVRKCSLQHEFRHRHIARCLLRGRSYKQIENKIKDPLNHPNSNLINLYLEEYSALLGLDTYPSYRGIVAHNTFNLEYSQDKIVSSQIKIKIAEDSLKEIQKEISQEEERNEK